MPTNRLAQKIHEILVRAAPDSVHQVPELVRRAQDERIDDDELLNLLCFRYKVGRDGWPVDPRERRRARLHLFFRNNDPKEMHKADILNRQEHFGELELMQKLYATYNRDELGDPVGDDEWVAAKLRHVFMCVAPEKVADIPRYVSRWHRHQHQQHAPLDRHVFLEQVCEEFGVGTDGWPNDPLERRRARLIRFFTRNAPEELRKVEALVQVALTEKQIFAELYERFGQDEFGRPVRSVQRLRHKLTMFFRAAAPDQLDKVETLLEYQQQSGIEDDAVMQLVQDQYNATEDGWATDKDERLRARVRRFFLTNAPADMRKADALCKLRGISEEEIMRQLYRKYGRNEFGDPVLDEEAAQRDRVAEFYEQYVPEEDVEQLTEQAMSLRLPSDELMELLAQRYAGIEPKPNKLRQRLKLIYRRAAPDSMAQVRVLMNLKRRDRVEDADIVATVCDKFGVTDEGWPVDETARRRRRLLLFFRNNDPDRLAEINDLCAADHPQSEEELMRSLFTRYGKDELGDGVDVRSGSSGSGGGSRDSQNGTVADGSLRDTDNDDADDDVTRNERGGRRRDGNDRDSRTMDQLEHQREHGTTTSPPRSTAAFAPGRTQIWPPPNQDTLEALHRTDLYRHLVAKYGGSHWSRIAAANYTDRFAKFANRFDDVPGWCEPEGFCADSAAPRAGGAPSLPFSAQLPREQQVAASVLGGPPIVITSHPPTAAAAVRSECSARGSTPATAPIERYNREAGVIIAEARRLEAAREGRRAAAMAATDTLGVMEPLHRDRPGPGASKVAVPDSVRMLADSAAASAARSQYRVLCSHASQPTSERGDTGCGALGGVPNASVKSSAALRQRAAATVYEALTTHEEWCHAKRREAVADAIAFHHHHHGGGGGGAAGPRLRKVDWSAHAELPWIADEQRLNDMFAVETQQEHAQASSQVADEHETAGQRPTRSEVKSCSAKNCAISQHHSLFAMHTPRFLGAAGRDSTCVEPPTPIVARKVHFL